VTPPQKPGRSRQDYQTPPAFLRAVERMLNIPGFDLDLAATRETSVAPSCLTPEQDALTVNWPVIAGWAWLNPPYARLEPWVARCAFFATLGMRLAVLLPAGVGTRWYATHVHGHAFVLFLRPRLTFVGETAPYPKDLLLALYDGPRIGAAPWDWQERAP